jgi:iron complex outermembrane receptor protein
MVTRRDKALFGLGVASATLLCCAAVPPALAQAPAATPANELEEITVTARRREESLQEVPVSVIAISGDQLVARGFETQESFNRMVPNVVIHGSNGFFGRQEGSFQMRGIGNVSILYDGIAHPETFGIVQSNITEVDHVEVLRGPQGTLFGKEAMGGVIQYVTVKPADTFGVRAKVAVGSYNRIDVSAIVDLPISDTLLTKFSIGKLSRDGYVTQAQLPGSKKLGSQSDTLADADILWKPSERFSWRVGLSYANNTNNGNPIQNFAVNTGDPTAANPCGVTHPAGQAAPDLTCLYNAIGLTIPQSNAYGAAQRYVTDSTYKGPDLYTTIHGVTSNLTFKLNDQLTLKSLSGYRTVRNFDYTDFDATKYNIFEGKNYNEQDEGTTELQLQVTTDRLLGTNGVYAYLDNQRAHRMNWFQNDLRFAVSPANNALAITWLQTHINPLTGLPYPASNGANPAGGQVGPVAGNGNVDALTYNYSKGYAFFSEWTWKATDKLSATLGARYNSDKVYNRNYGNHVLYPLPIVCCEPVASTAPDGIFVPSAATTTLYEGTFTNTAPKGSIQYQWTPALMTYVSYGEGFNRGGASATRGTPTVPSVFVPVDPEKVKSYEVGIRSDLFDGRARINATYFLSKQIGIKLNQDIGGINVQRNAGEAETKGLEFDAYWAITNSVMFTLSGGTNSATLTKLNPGVPLLNFNVGQTLNYAPEKSLSGGLAWHVATANGGAVTLRGDYGWQSEQWSTNDLTNRVLISAFGLLNARLSYEAPEKKYEVSLSGTNVLNTYYRINGYLVPNLFNNVGTPGRPAEFALTISTRL